MHKSDIKKFIHECFQTEIKNFLSESFKKECEKSFENLGVNIRKDYRSFLERFISRWDAFEVRHATETRKQGKDIKAVAKALKKHCNEFLYKADVLEETFLSIYSNIKRNQFIYAYYPEEWNETFLEYKEKVKRENQEFQHLIKPQRGKDDKG